ncbi:MAG: Lrp/AsnC family transcriptional regulator [Paracoccaceae bacterium]|nr:Lrp/AsnC family transcriptional regulator [Paracoccaceae bacterium]MDG1739753.1 Lrp/AsnC family transcriptional regulator [Paracoccaceae bacterium]MDG2260292.1 Lrp/AsnC family transcriptional regulator [Paracoccaceae bacterium]
MIDEIDKRLLSAVQTDAQLTAQELGEVLNLSPSQAGRRRQRLEADGYISSYRARIDPKRVDLSIQAFVQVQMVSHTPEQAKSLSRLLETSPEVVSGWTLTGDADYLLRVFCKDLSALNVLIHETLLPHPAVARIQSQIVMDQVKPDSPLPL